jgi:hypothetical protein
VGSVWWMMDDFYFNDSTTGVVDDWIKEIKDDDQQQMVGKAGQQPILGFDNQDRRKNYGLGYENKSTKQEKKDDVLVERMMKQKKKQSSQAAVVDITHGIVEEEILSRASSVGQKRKLSQEETKQNSIVNISTPSQGNQSKGPKPLPIGGADVGNMNGELLLEDTKPKRIKTRSKQKNIRRDKRGTEFKPSHLQIGSKDYQGRPLTKETKAILGLPMKKKPTTRR